MVAHRHADPSSNLFFVTGCLLLGEKNVICLLALKVYVC